MTRRFAARSALPLAACILWLGTGLQAQGADGAERAPADVSAEVEELLAIVRVERQRIAELQREVDERRAALESVASRLASLAAAPATPAPDRPQTPAAPPRPPETPRFDFYGDTLMRLSTTHQGYEGCVGCPARSIGRMRVRFGMQGNLSANFRGVLGISAGELNDPNSVYQTFGGNLSRKPVSFDRAYVVFQPKRASWLDLMAGKFPYPWVRSSMTFDVDFYPEGWAGRATATLAGDGALKTLSVQGLQVIVNEQANGPDTQILGGQAIASLLVTPRWTSRVIVTGLEIPHPEFVLRSQLDGSNVGVRNTNVTSTTGSQTFYASGFRYANVIVENTITTSRESLPISFAAEFHRNFRAASSRDTAASFRFDAGRSQRRGDVGFGWHIFRVEQESIMSALGESDWRAPSNVLQQRFQAYIMLDDHAQTLFTWYRGRTLDRDAPGALLIPGLPPGMTEPWANRLYFDVLYRF